MAATKEGHLITEQNSEQTLVLRERETLFVFVFQVRVEQDINDPLGQTQHHTSIEYYDFHLKICFGLQDFEKYHGFTYRHVWKILITSGRDCGLAEWIIKQVKRWQKVAYIYCIPTFPKSSILLQLNWARVKYFIFCQMLFFRPKTRLLMRCCQSCSCEGQRGWFLKENRNEAF